ncbi:PaaX family transcriptional regulator C-terminal domain-containing protein [Arthrobacter sp. NPDC058130]|uniref:PaaX family transcriptional regulator C-terminal domain-containing protein n=1 Tax=Arthrobacter sp. NPDC058130 TaxID=3346353 RepID=UPI0036DFD989
MTGVRTELMDAWRAFPWSDPDLSAELLPEGWPRTATAYVEEVVAREAPELAVTARVLSVTSGL